MPEPARIIFEPGNFLDILRDVGGHDVFEARKVEYVAVLFYVGLGFGVEKVLVPSVDIGDLDSERRIDENRHGWDDLFFNKMVQVVQDDLGALD